MKFFLVLLFAATLALSWASTTRFMEYLLRGYDKNDLPSDGQTNLKLGIYMNSITLDREAMSMKVLMYLRQSWQDDRLIHSGSVDKRRVPSEFIDRIWQPDIFFRNAKTIQAKRGLTDERLMTVNTTGGIWFVQSLYVDFWCDLSKLESAVCTIFLESFGNLQDQLNFQWLDNPNEIDASVATPRYDLQDTILYNCSQNYTAGAFTCLEAKLMFKGNFQIIQ